MPSALTDERLALDETSLDFRHLDATELEEHLDVLNEVLDNLHQQGLAVYVHPWLWETVECLDGLLLCNFLFDPGSTTMSRDTLRLLGIHLDRCQTWSEKDPGFGLSVEAVEMVSVGTGMGVRLDPAFSVGIVLSQPRTMACLVFGGCAREGYWQTADGTGRVFFFHRDTDLVAFWRSLYSHEQIHEQQFFSLAALAFPNLVFHPGLNFGKFTGSYQELRDEVAKILAAVNDRFATAMSEQAGIPHQVQAALGPSGVDISPESPGTRGSSALMALRDVDLDGHTYRCEWHAKIRPDRNRIHFSLPVPGLNDRIVVGIFTEHLDT